MQWKLKESWQEINCIRDGEERKESWHLLVKIREVKTRVNPLAQSFNSFNINAVIFSFYGERNTTCQLFQKLNHASRIYII